MAEQVGREPGGDVGPEHHEVVGWDEAEELLQRNRENRRQDRVRVGGQRRAFRIEDPVAVQRPAAERKSPPPEIPEEHRTVSEKPHHVRRKKSGQRPGVNERQRGEEEQRVQPFEDSLPLSHHVAPQSLFWPIDSHGPKRA